MATIEQKAKAYDEALERARKELQACGSSDCDAARQIFRFFPELAESKDEMIRTNLIELLLDTPSQDIISHHLGLNEVLAWVEKQGKQKPDTDFSDLRTWKYIVDAVWTEKEGIGQYLDSPFTEEVAKKLQKRFGNIEQKSAKWSEEDELHIRELESLVKRVWAIAEHENDKESIHKMSDLSFFLKTFEPQPKQEWSKEEKEAINSSIAHFKRELADVKTGKILCEKYAKHIKALKSLRPQNRWKPSDMELEVLRLAAEKDGTCLMGLYEQLKKLREE